MFNDINFLVQETLKEAEKLPPAKGALFNFFHAKDEPLPDEVPGFLYHLQKKISTFVIRIHPSSNLKEDYQNILKHPNMFPSLRLHEGEGSTKEKVAYFECDRLIIAQNIKEHLSNKRFPLFEERVLNISDPGDSWWLNLEKNKIEILFKLSHMDNIKTLIKLGPLADSHKCVGTINQLLGYFKMLFPVESYSCGDAAWSMTCTEDNNANFENLKSLFKDGETSHDFWEFLRRLESSGEGTAYLESLQKANYFLMELSFIRNFWKSIEEKLS